MKKMIAGLALGTAVLGGCAAEPTEADTEDAVSAEDALAQLGPEPEGKASRHAIVLAHGFNASNSNGWSFHNLDHRLEADGHVVKEGNVQPFAGVVARATELAKYVDAAIEKCREKQGCDPSKVHIIAHSMGGLDSRYLAAKLSNAEGVPYSKLIASITTISSPHRGTPIADKLLSFTPGSADGLVDAVAKILARDFTERTLADQTDVRDALTSLSEAETAKFNNDVIDVPSIYYQSWAGISSYVDPHIDDYERVACDGKVESYKNRHDQLGGLQLKATALVVGAGGKANDGLVSVESAKWGNFMGCIPADHLDEVGQPAHDYANFWSRFDHIRFYRHLVYGLDAAVDAHGGQR